MLRFHPDAIWGGFAKAHLRRKRASYGLTGLVEIHHVVPRELRHHPRLRAEGYDVEAAYNTIFAPSKWAPAVLRLHPTRPIHTGGHPKYNAWVRSELDGCPPGLSAFLAVLLAFHLGSRGRTVVPWRGHGASRQASTS